MSIVFEITTVSPEFNQLTRRRTDFLNSYSFRTDTSSHPHMTLQEIAL